MKKVLLGMSGGVDSTVSALLLKRAGYEVCGVTFIMHSSQLPSVGSAAEAASQVGVPHTTVDLRDRFEKQVIQSFTGEYLSGNTPNPCVICNAGIKFPELVAAADRSGCEFIATGHYASVICENGIYYISAAADEAKDQSYFLYMLGQPVLSRLLLPLSGLKKPDIRNIAAEAGLSCAERHDSQDVCFIPDGNHIGFIQSYTGHPDTPGDIVDTCGRILGHHNGLYRYTVGQRKGVGVAAGVPLYVVGLDVYRNTVILGSNEELFRSEISVKDCVFTSGIVPDAAFRADVKIRYTRKSAAATVTPVDDGCCKICFDTPQRAPSRGQAAVFFDGGRLTGGGTIC